MSEESKTKPDLDPEVERELREAADAQDQLAKDMKDKCQYEFQKRASLLTDQFQVVINNQMSHVGDRYTSNIQDRITTQQTDILKINKVFRDVARDLGADWKPVFQHLMRDREEKELRVEMARIERQKPFMQAFKALNTWKDCVGDKFDIRQMVEALMSVDRRELAERVMDILDNNGLDDLYSVDAVGKGIAGGAPLRQRPAPVAEGDAAAATGGETKPKPAPEKKAAPAADPIADLVLLKIAKAFGKEWQPLADSLELSEQDMSDCKETGSDSYQGGFKALYTWRDNQIEEGKLAAESAQALKGILNKLGKTDLVNTIS